MDGRADPPLPPPQPPQPPPTTGPRLKDEPRRGVVEKLSYSSIEFDRRGERVRVG